MHIRRIIFAMAGALVLAGSGIAIAAGGGGGRSGGSFGGGAAADPNKAFQDGIAFLQESEYRKAERKFRDVLKAVPKNADANFYMGVAKMGRDKPKEAARYFKKAVKYDDEMYQAYEQLGLAYLANGKTEDAQQTLSDLAEQMAACGESCPYKLQTAYTNLKSALEGGGSAPASDQTSLLFDGTSDPRAAYLDAVKHINNGRFETAIDELRAVMHSAGPHPDVLNYLGFAHRKLGRFEKALGFYQQALALDPMHRGANEYLGELYVETRQMEKARERLATLSKACPFGCAEFEDLKDRIDAVFVAGH